MLEEKQMRAEAARCESLKSREIRLQTRTSKIQQLQSKKEEERRQLQKQLEERLSEAEQRRRSILRTRRGKANDERQLQIQEFSKKSLQFLEEKKEAVRERQDKIRARKMEIEIDRIRKAEENAAKEEAALERRSYLEKERLAKLQIMEEKRRELELRKEEERQALLAQKEFEKEEKARRLAEFKSEKMLTVNQMKQEIDRKLEKGSKIHHEHIGQVKERATAVGDKAREVAARKTPQKHGASDCSSSAVDRSEEVAGSLSGSSSIEQDAASLPTVLGTSQVSRAECGKSLKVLMKDLRNSLKEENVNWPLVESSCEKIRFEQDAIRKLESCGTGLDVCLSWFLASLRQEPPLVKLSAFFRALASLCELADNFVVSRSNCHYLVGSLAILLQGMSSTKATESLEMSRHLFCILHSLILSADADGSVMEPEDGMIATLHTAILAQKVIPQLHQCYSTLPVDVHNISYLNFVETSLSFLEKFTEVVR